jgi:tripartite-type tricarboxylate transporter receptor subunit TctC
MRSRHGAKMIGYRRCPRERRPHGGNRPLLSRRWADNRIRQILIAGFLAGAALANGASTAFADTAGDFFKGKQLTFYVGYEPGTSYDIYVRLIAPYIVANLPGTPTLIVRNMPGASTVALTNFMSNVAPRDGTTIAAVHERIGVEPLLSPGNDIYKYDALKLSWIGSITSQTGICFLWHDAQAKTLRDLMAESVIVGGSGRTGDDSVGARVMNAVLGAKLKLIEGYSGTSIYLAIERREIDGRCGFGWPGLKATKPDWIRDKKINVLIQLALRKHPELPDVPLIMDLVKNEEDRTALKLLFGTQVMGRPIFAPPGVPPARVLALRHAFDAAVRDRQFLADARQRQLDVDPASGTEIQALLEDIYTTPKAIVDRVIGFREGSR